MPRAAGIANGCGLPVWIGFVEAAAVNEDRKAYSQRSEAAMQA